MCLIITELNKFLPKNIIDNVIMDYLLPEKMDYLIYYRNVIHELTCLRNFINYGNHQWNMDYYFQIHKLDFLFKVLKIKTKKCIENIKPAGDYKINIMQGFHDYNEDKTIFIMTDINLRTSEMMNYGVHEAKDFLREIKSEVCGNEDIDFKPYEPEFKLCQGQRFFKPNKNYKFKSVCRLNFSYVLDEHMPKLEHLKPTQCEMVKYLYCKNHPSKDNVVMRFRDYKQSDFHNINDYMEVYMSRR